MAKPGHGDHWLAALDPGDPRLHQALAVPTDAPDEVALHRSPLTDALDLVQVTARGRLVTAYPEPRATTLLTLRPRELGLWDTHVEGWLVADHETVGTLTLFLTDLVENAERYQKTRGPLQLETGALAYSVHHARPDAGPDRLRPARPHDDRFLPDDYAFDATVDHVRPAGAHEVLDLRLHGGLVLPTVTKDPTSLLPGQRATGYAWLTARWPAP